MSTYGPGYGVATDLTPNVCQIDYTTVEVFIAETIQPLTYTIQEASDSLAQKRLLLFWGLGLVLLLLCTL